MNMTNFDCNVMLCSLVYIYKWEVTEISRWGYKASFPQEKPKKT